MVGCALYLSVSAQHAQAHTLPPTPDIAALCDLLEEEAYQGAGSCEVYLGELVANALARIDEDARDSHVRASKPRRTESPEVVAARVQGWAPLVESHFGPESTTALCIMWNESRGDPTAHNETSGASGLFQHLPQYWEDRSTKAGYAGTDIFDPTANVAVAAWLQRVGGWTHWSPWKRGECR